MREMGATNSPRTAAAQAPLPRPEESSRRPSRGVRGLGSLLAKTQEPPRPERGEALEKLPLGAIARNPHQPRQEFDERDLEGLAESIKEKGLLQPVVVRKRSDGGFELVSGERRLRAARKAGLKEIPAIVRDVGEEEMLVLALVENLQREDLNAVEEATAYRELISRFSLKHEEVAHALGKSRPTITNSLRLLELPGEILDMVRSGELSEGHARVLLGIEGEGPRVKLARKVASKGMSVRDLEKLVRRSKPAKKRRKLPHIAEIERLIGEKLGTKVEIIQGRKKGRIIVEFYSNDDFERIMEAMGTRLSFT